MRVLLFETVLFLKASGSDLDISITTLSHFFFFFVPGSKHVKMRITTLEKATGHGW